MTGVPPSFEHPAPPNGRPELPEGVHRPEPPPPTGRELRRAGLPDWPVWAPFAAMLLTLVVALVGVTTIAVFAELLGADVSGDDPPPGVTIAGTYVQDFALIGAALLLARQTAGRISLAHFGLRAVPARLALRWTAIVWVGFFAVSAVWAAALDIQNNDDLPERLGTDSSTGALIAVAILVCVAAPIAEEFFFRGFLFTAVRRRLGLWPGAVISGAIFGGIHLGGTEIEFIVPLMVFGIGLCLLYAKTGSIVPCIVLHALNNGLALGVAEGWDAATLAAMVGAAVAVLAIVWPFARRHPVAVPA